MIKLKKAVAEFNISMIDGLNDTIINYQIINFELDKLCTLMVNHLKMLSVQIIKKRDQERKAKVFSDY